MTTATTNQLFSMLSEAQQKELLTKFLGGKATEVPAKPENEVPAWKLAPASYKQKIRLISFGDEKVWNPSEIVLDDFYEDGEGLTFGELFETSDRNGKRHFPMIWDQLTAGEASEIYPILQALPDRPKAEQPKYKQNQKPKASAGRNFQPKAGNDDSDLRSDVATLKALVQQLAEGQFAQPAKPVADAGVTKKPKASVPAKPEIVKLAEGQIVEWDGKLVRLTRQANGRIGQQMVSER